MEIINNNNFKSLYSTIAYKKNQVILKLSGKILDKPTRTSIEIGKDKHIEDELGQYMNHSFQPTCKIENDCVIALHDIEKGTELNFNYNENETNMACPFVDKTTDKIVSGINNN